MELRIYECDRCGARVEFHAGEAEPTVYQVSVLGKGEDIDLCANCYVKYNELALRQSEEKAAWAAKIEGEIEDLLGGDDGVIV